MYKQYNYSLGYAQMHVDARFSIIISPPLSQSNKDLAHVPIYAAPSLDGFGYAGIFINAFGQPLLLAKINESNKITWCIDENDSYRVLSDAYLLLEPHGFSPTSRVPGIPSNMNKFFQELFNNYLSGQV